MTLPRVASATAESSNRIIVQFSQAMTQNAELTDSTNYSITPAIPDAANKTVTVLSVSSVAIDLTVNMSAGETYTVEVSQEITNVLGQVLDFQYTTASFLGIGSNPRVTSAVALNAETIRCVFSEPMRLAELSDASNFFVASQETGRRVAITSSSPTLDGDGFYRETVLGIAGTSKMTNGGQHLLEARDLFDIVGNGGSPSTTTFTGIAELPRVCECEVIAESRKLVVTFDSPMSETWLTAPGAFRITSEALGAPDGYYESSKLSSDKNSLTLEISELRIGAPYTVTATGLVRDEFGNMIDPEYNTANFTGVGDIPVLLRAVSTGRNRIDLIFSEAMRDSPETRDVTRYTSDNGLTFVSVLSVEDNVIKLVTSTQVSGESYTITVTS